MYDPRCAHHITLQCAYLTVGQDALTEGSGKFKATLAKATPGVLFVDEVYQLDPKGNGEGRAITNMIMRASEDDRDKLTIIVAG